MTNFNPTTETRQNQLFFTDHFIFSKSQLLDFVVQVVKLSEQWEASALSVASSVVTTLYNQRADDTPMMECPINQMPKLTLDEIRQTDWADDVITQVVQENLKFESAKMILIMDPYACGALAGFLFEQVPLLEDNDQRKAPLLALLHHMFKYIDQSFPEIQLQALGRSVQAVSSELAEIITEFRNRTDG